MGPTHQTHQQKYFDKHRYHLYITTARRQHLSVSDKELKYQLIAVPTLDILFILNRRSGGKKEIDRINSWVNIIYANNKEFFVHRFKGGCPQQQLENNLCVGGILDILLSRFPFICRYFLPPPLRGMFVVRSLEFAK